MLYLIIGGNGFLGSYFINELKSKKQKIIATCRDFGKLRNDEYVEWVNCDVNNQKNVDNLVLKMAEYDSYNIIYLAACHHPDFVEKHPSIAWETNIIALSIFLNKMKNVRCFFYPSTDTVYGEGSLDYAFKEEDKTNPVNLYGKHKVLAENIVNTYGYNVVRFPFLIGPSLTYKKKHFFNTIKETIMSGQNIEMFEDSYRSTISFKQAADYSIELIEKYDESIPKILNVAGDKALSKHEVGIMIAKKYGVNPSLIIPISIKNDKKIFDTPRATTTLIDNSKLKKILNITNIELEL